ncbi:ribosome biogenesis protein BRX1 homolog [Cylas formicarius]|uniref:ribosome biogenesis protein BRX1 homolog n=1 Tax=Cylas formicarius TaxID=197179 RepID=UPI002958C503|nr:ribosome biogenesis protein BRX1 homolog [Cylas formicarius]
MPKKAHKRKIAEVETPEAVTVLPSVKHSEEPVPKRKRWTNKQRVLVLASRGINHRDRHLMEDIKKLMPHHKPEPKMERSKSLKILNEICEMKNCNKAILFEGRKKQDLYMWLSNISNGPSVKFLVENVFTMGELKLTGNCLRGSRPLLSFDPLFTETPYYNLLKELLVQSFGVPNQHPKSQPFFDHVYTFSIIDNKIWFRNFQILSEDGALAEIGPRFLLNPIKIFAESFGGDILWENPLYVSPAKHRQQVRLQAKNKYINRLQQKTHSEATRPVNSYKLTPLDDLFKEDPLKKANELVKGHGDESNRNEKTKKKKKHFVGNSPNLIVKNKKRHLKKS